MAEYPSLLIFPKNSKTESRKFTSSLSISVNNVLGFVLANLNRSLRLLGLVKACNYNVNFPHELEFRKKSLNYLFFLFQRQNSINDCIVTIQEEITDTISYALGEWRKHSRRRSAILRIIKKLKEIYLKLFRIRNSCDFIEIENDVVKIHKQWQKAF